MKSVLVGAAVSAVMMAGLAAPAYAVTIPPSSGPTTITVDKGVQFNGSFFSLDGRTILNPLPAAGTMFTDYYKFALSSKLDVEASFSLSGFDNKPTSVTLGLYRGSIGSGTYLASSNSPGLTFDHLGSIGPYYLQIQGTSQGLPGNYGGTASFRSTVPLPNSVALFGVAVAGLGVAGAARRRSTKAAV